MTEQALLPLRQTTLVSEELAAGRHSYTWNAEGLASGVYLYRLRSGSLVQTRKLILVK